MALQLSVTTTPAFNWFEKVKWNIKGIGDIKVAIDSPIVLQGKPKQVKLKLIRQIPVDQIMQAKPVTARIELRAANRPRTVTLSSMRIVLTVKLRPPAIQTTKISHKIVSTGRPQWSDLASSLVKLPIELEISVDGMVAPKTVLKLLPCKKITEVEGIPITIRSGRQTIGLTLTGKVDSAGELVKWPLQLEPPPPSYGIGYIKPKPVTVSFIAPDPVQLVVGKSGKIFNHYFCRANKPARPATGHGQILLAGSLINDSAADNLFRRHLLFASIHSLSFLLLVCFFFLAIADNLPDFRKFCNDSVLCNPDVTYLLLPINLATSYLFSRSFLLELFTDKGKTMEATLQSENVKQAAKIFEENSDMIRTAIRSQVNDKSIIDDIFQNLFLSLVQKPVPSNIENVEGYLRRAIRNDVIDSAIKRRCQRGREQRYAWMHSVRIRYCGPENTAAMSDVIQHIFEVIEDKLPAHEAKALIEKYRYNKDDGEAAEVLGITKRSFSHHLCTGLKKLRCCLQENESR